MISLSVDVIESHQYLGDKQNLDIRLSSGCHLLNYFKFQINTNKYWELLFVKNIVFPFLALFVLEGQKLSMRSMDSIGEEAIRTAV